MLKLFSRICPHVLSLNCDSSGESPFWLFRLKDSDTGWNGCRRTSVQRAFLLLLKKYLLEYRQRRFYTVVLKSLHSTIYDFLSISHLTPFWELSWLIFLYKLNDLKAPNSFNSCKKQCRMNRMNGSLESPNFLQITNTTNFKEKKAL